MDDASTRADRVLADLLKASDAGDMASVEAFASQLGTAHPELQAWSMYIQAGCRAVAGDPEAGLRLLAEADEQGGWWSPALLADPALATVWELGDRGIRARSEERWRAAVASAEVSWDVVRPSSPPRVIVISLHGNGPWPNHLFRPLWAELEWCATFLVRSPQFFANNVSEWRDRKRAMADMQTVARAARAAFGPTTPLILAGEGAGGRVAVNAVLDGAVDAAGAVAFAPILDPPDDAAVVPESRPRFCIFPGEAEASATSCVKFVEWARARGIECAVHREDGMGYSYPLRFRESVARAIEAVLGTGVPDG